ncbi:MAG: excinuclease ABC subunit UvrB [Bacteroidales bacterium]|jgi:excinuclease ABC subunit B|nr:excinuclease ABC subunit UvrB [Bacteroidales bacterium]MDD2204200.1 excinuclease ABC subunit UvrB [Bacteroidales bacterium]MDD3152255.1 excinuclease ABC subunit UvrB [Bacteroidales bacterium]MDD3913627.1 excinuclease ABC subunit UvrB [Bacteroidales bacterium]MDD4634728.1 excinuclease ABC subunit UvrB [Bacteroidales bacterium]
MSNLFHIQSDYSPTGDQPEAIKELSEGVLRGDKAQVLLGVTGSGKTFTMANVIANVNKPTLILSHNKTLAAQLYGEFLQFFPDNLVEYFVSYYDYYQPEAYIPSTNTYIEKDLQINENIEKMRLLTTSALLSGRRDIIVVSSVSCLYGIGNPTEFHAGTINLKVNMVLDMQLLLNKLVEALYSRNERIFEKGSFRVRGDTVDVYPTYSDDGVRIIFFDDEIESIQIFDILSGHTIQNVDELTLYPAKIFVTSQDTLKAAIKTIQHDMFAQTEYFKEIGKPLEAKRLEDRVTFDIEMMMELGYCQGIENYSRYLDGRNPGSRPFCLIDYFPEDYLMIIDESHATVPQIRAMYGGDRSRKEVLVDYGFRLPAALDNRPLKFEEFEDITNQIIYVSATPADYELTKAGGVIVEQVIRPTGLLEPPIIIRPSLNQMDDLIEEIDIVVKRDERVLVTTLTKRMAEELAAFLAKRDVRCQYIHSDIDTVERMEIMRGLRLGMFDVLIGVNLLREGLDLPEVSLVAILDADKEGFLRSERSLTQTAGRAARNINSKVIMYADKITDSMQKTIDETNRKRQKQIDYNTVHHITPQQIKKSKENILGQTIIAAATSPVYNKDEKTNQTIANDPIIKYMNQGELDKLIKTTKKKMDAAVKELDFIEAARLRDELMELTKLRINSK